MWCLRIQLGWLNLEATGHQGVTLTGHRQDHGRRQDHRHRAAAGAGPGRCTVLGLRLHAIRPAGDVTSRAGKAGMK